MNFQDPTIQKIHERYRYRFTYEYYVQDHHNKDPTINGTYVCTCKFRKLYPKDPKKDS